MGARFIEQEGVREDPTDDAPAALGVEPCGWNGSREVFSREHCHAAPCPADVRERLMRARALHEARAAQQRAQGLCL